MSCLATPSVKPENCKEKTQVHDYLIKASYIWGAHRDWPALLHLSRGFRKQVPFIGEIKFTGARESAVILGKIQRKGRNKGKDIYHGNGATSSV